MDAPVDATDPSTAAEPPRRARRLALGALGALLLLAGGAASWVAWPFLRDDLVLDRVVLAVALDWRDFGREKARARLEYELDHQRIGLQVTDEDCALVEDDRIRRVECAWTADVRVPLLGIAVPLNFRSVAELSPDGTTRRLR